MNTMPASNKANKTLTNAGSIEIEKLVLSLYIKGGINKDQIKELADSLLQLHKDLPDDVKELH